MTLIIKGAGLTVEDVVNVARNNQKVELHPDALNGIKKCRAMLEKKIDAREIMYGVNTGIGEFSEVVLDDDQVKDFQKYLETRAAARRLLKPLLICLIKGLPHGYVRKVRLVPAATLPPCRRSPCS